MILFLRRKKIKDFQQGLMHIVLELYNFIADKNLRLRVFQQNTETLKLKQIKQILQFFLLKHLRYLCNLWEIKKTFKVGKMQRKNKQ
jgi:hypothetical protein